jgi:hypothetical protein
MVILSKLEELKILRQTYLKYNLESCVDTLKGIFYVIETCNTRLLDSYVRRIIPFVEQYKGIRLLAIEAGVNVSRYDEELANCNPHIDHVPFDNKAIGKVERI